MKLLRVMIAGGLGLGLVAGCATVHIYVTFPQEKIESAAESFLMDLESAAPSGGRGDSRLNRSLASLWRPAEVHAQTLSRDLRMDSPAIGQARVQMRERLDDLRRLKEEKRVGERRDGLLEVLRETDLDREALAAFRRLVREENRDRMNVYREIVRLNNMPAEQVEVVQKSFGAVYIRLARPGEMIEDEKEGWIEKKPDEEKAGAAD